MPSCASWSRRGVGAPRSTPPPYTPSSPQPWLSTIITTTLGCSPLDAIAIDPNEINTSSDAMSATLII